ncbi:MAG: DUF4258 domain-containing protein [Candidatus Diapherotrites archaeon]|nr:DUF4258 domain-containing protein [Candidatus Diapherotrites archaeon]
MKVKITNHARERMEIYGISEEQVFGALSNPDATLIGSKGRKIAQKRLNSYVLRVIYEDVGWARIVVTVYKAKRERYEI